MNRFILFIIVSYLFFVCHNVNAQSPLAQSEYDCLKRLSRDTGNTFATFPNSDIIDFCRYTNIIICSGSFVTRLVDWTMVGNGDLGISTSSFTCFSSSLQDIKLSNAFISNDFLYGSSFNNLNSLELNNPNISTIDNFISPLKSLNITFKSSLSILYVKYLKNVESFSSSTSIDIYYNDLLEINSRLKYLNIYTKSLPNLSNYNSIQKLTVTGDFNFDLSSLNNNIGNQKGSLSLIMLDGTSNGGTLPCTDFPSTQINQNQLLTDITFINVCFNKVTTKIDISNSKISSLYISSPGLNFNYDTLSVFPFDKLHFGSLYIESAKFDYVEATLLQFSNTTSLTLKDCQINGQFVSKTSSMYPILNLLNVANNLIVGTVDSTWCTTSLNVSNNKLSDTIPTCYSCYLSDPNIYYLFNGNYFTNLNSNSTCEDGIIVPSIETVNSDSRYISISGSNLPLLDNQIKSKPSMNWSTLVKSKSFSGTLSNIQQYSTIDLIFIEKYNFTLSLVYQEPIVSTITYDQETQSFIIHGSYFSYDKEKVDIKIYESDCVVTSASFYKIVCSAPSPYLNTRVQISFKIDPYPVQYYLIESDVNNIGCSSSCSGGTCYMDKGVCVYCQVDIDCNGGFCSIEGLCQCPIDLTGPICNLPNQYITDVVPSNVTGGLVVINGWFGEIHDNILVTIGSDNCNITLISKSTILCSIGPGSGIKSINITQNNIVYIGVDIYRYQESFKQCPNNCSTHGTCLRDTGYCSCFEGWGKYDCSIQLDVSQNDTMVKVNETSGTTQINNQEIQYEILFISINEINILGESIKEYPLLNKWSYNKTSSTDSISVFNHIINGTIVLSSTIEEVREDKQFSFAGIDFTVGKGSIKSTMSISNWNYQSSLNTLQVRMKSSIDQIKSTDCNTDTLVNIIDDYGSINYMTISKNNKILYSRIQDRVLSNQKPTFSKVSLIDKQSNSIIIGINFGHCNECILDPDFSLLIDNNISNSNCNSTSRKWLLPVVIIVPVVGVSIIFVIVMVLIKKHRFVIKSKLNQLKLKTFK